MKILEILKIFAATATILTGIFSLLKPTAVYEFTGLQAQGGRGITDIRAILGALFIALGVMSIVFRKPETYSMLGISYLAIGVVRFISMFVDKSVVKSNLISLVTEFFLGLILIF